MEVKIWSLCSVSSTLSHANLEQPFRTLAINWEVNIIVKKSSCFLSSCVFLCASVFTITESLWYGKWVYNKCMECFRLLFNYFAWIKHQFLSGIRDSRKAGSLWGIMRGLGRVRKSIHQSWFAKRLGLGLGLLCWGFKGVQEEIPREEANTLEIESVAFPWGQCTSPQLHPCYRLFDQDGHQDSSSASL